MTYPNMLLSEIREGMAVFDKQDNKVGNVVLAYSGEGEYVAEANFGMEPSSPDVQEAVDSDRLRDEVRERLLSEGFIKLSTGGLFPGTRFIMPAQVSDVDIENNRLSLSVEGSDLLKG